MVTSTKLSHKLQGKVLEAKKQVQWKIFAQPKSLYRWRYSSEKIIKQQSTPKKKTIKRKRYYLPASTKSNCELPAVSIPTILKIKYIHVALVTIANKYISEHFVHPYLLKTVAGHPKTHKDKAGYFFEINQTDLERGFKQFHLEIIIPKGTKRTDFQRLPVFDLKNKSSLGTFPKACRKKTMFEVYDLDSAHLVFSQAKRLPDGKFQVLYDTSIVSDIISHKPPQTGRKTTKNGKRNTTKNRKRNTTKIRAHDANETYSIVCNPASSQWEGGNDVNIKFKDYKATGFTIFNVCFDFPEQNGTTVVPYQILTDTILNVKAPKCPIITDESNLIIPITVKANEVLIGRFDFRYEKQNVSSTENTNLNSSTDTSSVMIDSSTNHEFLTSNIDILPTHAVHNIASEINNVLTTDISSEQQTSSTTGPRTNITLSITDLDNIIGDEINHIATNNHALEKDPLHQEFTTSVPMDSTLDPNFSIDEFLNSQPNIESNQPEIDATNYPALFFEEFGTTLTADFNANIALLTNELHNPFSEQQTI